MPRGRALAPIEDLSIPLYLPVSLMHLAARSTNLALLVECAVTPREEQGPIDLTAAELLMHLEAWSVNVPGLANCAAAPFEEQGAVFTSAVLLMHLWWRSF